MNPAIIGIVNYRRRPRGSNIARASCQSAEIVKNTWTRTTGDSRVDSDQTFGQCIEASACASISALLCLLCFGLRLKSQTKHLVWDFSLGPKQSKQSKAEIQVQAEASMHCPKVWSESTRLSPVVWVHVFFTIFSALARCPSYIRPTRATPVVNNTNYWWIHRRHICLRLRNNIMWFGLRLKF